MKVAECKECGAAIEASVSPWEVSGDYAVIIVSECGHIEPLWADLKVIKKSKR
jgi:hypothetical protein